MCSREPHPNTSTWIGNRLTWKKLKRAPQNNFSFEPKIILSFRIPLHLPQKFQALVWRFIEYKNLHISYIYVKKNLQKSYHTHAYVYITGQNSTLQKFSNSQKVEMNVRSSSFNLFVEEDIKRQAISSEKQFNWSSNFLEVNFIKQIRKNNK